MSFSFWSWIKISSFFDILCITFIGAFIYQSIKLNKKINNLNNSLVVIDEKCESLKDDINLAINNPLAAKRKLKNIK